MRVVLTAVAWLAWRDRTRYPAYGLRSLSLATGGMLDPDTIADALTYLRTLPAEICPLVLLERHDGHHGDRYQLVLATRLPAVDAGQVDEPRPIPALWGTRSAGERQATLGPVSWWLYQHLQATGPAGATAAALVASSGLSRSAVYHHLQLLAAYGLATGTARTSATEPAATWSAGPLCIEDVSQHIGADAWFQDLVGQYRAERRVWRAWRAEQAELRAARRQADVDQAVPVDPDAALWQELLADGGAWLSATGPGPDPGPPEPAMTSGDEAIALLTEALGAVLLADPAPVAVAPQWVGAAADPRAARQIAAITASISQRRARD